MKKRHISIVCFAIISVLLLSQIAIAANPSLVSYKVVIGYDVKVKSQSLGTYNFHAGLFELKMSDSSTYYGYCIDINRRLGTGSVNLYPAPDTKEFRTMAYITTWFDPWSDPSGMEAASIQGAIWRVRFSPPYGIISPSSIVTRLNQIYNEANSKDVVRLGDTLTLEASKSSSFTITATLKDKDGKPRIGVKIVFSTTAGTLSQPFAFTDSNGQVIVELSGLNPTDSPTVTASTIGKWPIVIDIVDRRKQDLIRIGDPYKLEESIYIPAEVFRIFGYKFYDINRNGIKDDGEVGLPDWTIQLWNETQTEMIAQTTTDSNGNYGFTGLEAGKYIVKEILKNGWANTTPIEVPVEVNVENPEAEVNFGNTEGTTLEARVTAEGNLTRTFHWDIDKSVIPDVWHLFVGDSGTSQYNVTVTKDKGTDEAYINGTVCVKNTGVFSTENLQIIVKLYYPESPPNDLIATVNVDVSAHSILTPGETYCYPYKINIPSDDIHPSGTYNVTAYVTITNYSGHMGIPYGPSPSTTTGLSEPTLINDVIHVDDTNGYSWTFNANGSQIYYKTFKCNNATIVNTATIKETGQSDSASVEVHCYVLKVTKTAETSFKRIYKWAIDKWADKSCLTLCAGKTGTVKYSVKVWVTGTVDSDWAVSGTVTIYNPAPIPATINSVSDIISGFGAVTVNFDPSISFPYTLAAGGTLTGTYSTSLPNGSSRTNTATATLQNYDYDYLKIATPNGTTDFSGSANVDFSKATITEVDKSIRIRDILVPDDGKVSPISVDLGTVTYGVDTLPKIFTYSRTFGPYYACTYTYKNTASFVTSDTGTTGSDSWTVVVKKY